MLSEKTMMTFQILYDDVRDLLLGAKPFEQTYKTLLRPTGYLGSLAQ